VMGCAIPIDYVTADDVNAYTDDKKIVIYSGIVALAKTDAQLAHVIGHELAHANLGHGDKRLVNRTLGWLGGTAIDVGILAGGISTGGAFGKEFTKAGALAYSVNFEREADYVGAYYAVRAGYDLNGVEEFWRTFGLAHPDSIRLAKTHPITPVRFLQMQQVAVEIADKRRRNLPLVPDLKFVPSEDEPAAANASQF